MKMKMNTVEQANARTVFQWVRLREQSSNRFVKGFVKKETDDGGFSIKITTVICCGSKETGAIRKF